MNYVDFKVTVWKRAKFKDNADIEMLKNLLKENELFELFEEKFGFLEVEQLSESIEPLSIKQNCGKPTIELYKDDVKVYDNSAVLSVQSILEVVADYYKIEVEDILSDSRKKDFVMARHIVAYLLDLARKELNLNYQKITFILRRKSHASIAHSKKVVNNIMEYDSKFKSKIDYFLRLFNISV